MENKKDKKTFLDNKERNRNIFIGIVVGIFICNIVLPNSKALYFLYGLFTGWAFFKGGILEWLKKNQK